MVLRLEGLTQWIASFRKRLENVYLVCMVRRIEIRDLMSEYEFLRIRPINHQSLLGSIGSGFLSLSLYPSLAGNKDTGDMVGLTLAKVLNKTAPGSLKGVTPGHIRYIRYIRYYPPVFFQRCQVLFNEGLTLARQKYMPIIILQRQIYNRKRIDTPYEVPPGMHSKHMIPRQIHWQKGCGEMAGQDNGLFRYNDKILLIKNPYGEIGIEEKRGLISPNPANPALLKRDRGKIERERALIPESILIKNHEKQMDGMRSVSGSSYPEQGIPMIKQERIRSVRPYQRVGQESIYGDPETYPVLFRAREPVSYGDREDVSTDFRMVKGLPSRIKSLTLRSEEFGGNVKMYKSRQWDQTVKYIKWPEKPDYAWVSENIRLMYEGRHMERMAELYTGWRISMITQGRIRSVRPYQRVVRESAYVDPETYPLSYGAREPLSYGERPVLYGDMEDVRANVRTTAKELPSMAKGLSSYSGGHDLKMGISQRDKKRRYVKGPDKPNYAGVPGNIRLMYEGRHMERIAKVYSGWRISMIAQGRIRSVKPYYQRLGRGSAHVDPETYALSYGARESLSYGDRPLLYGGREEVRADARTTLKGSPSMAKGLSSYSGGHDLRMGINQREKKRKYVKKPGKTDYPKVSDAFMGLDHDGPESIRQRHQPVHVVHQKKADDTHMDNSSAIPLKIQDKAEGARGRYDSIPDKVQEYHKGVPLNGDMKSFYGTTRVQNPVQGKRDMRELGISIDYNKLADNVYEILTRRIIREKERMGGLL